MATKRGLKFLAASHRYYLDGRPVPGVTTICGVLDKPALPRWAAKSVAEYVADHRDAIDHLYDMGRAPMVDALKVVPWERRDSAAARGTTLHDIADQIVRGQDVDVPDSLVPVVESAVRFMEDWHIEPILTETAVGSREHWYAGTLDLVADSNRAPRAIYDWKSGKAIYTGAAWQMNAYGHAEFHGLDGHEHPVSELGIEAAYGVHIRPDGYDVYPLRYGPDIFAEWLTIRAAYDINARANGDWRNPGSGYVGRAIQNREDIPA